MATLQINWTVTDSDGSTASGVVNAVSDTLTASAAVSPASAPAGALRTLTVTASSSAGATLTFGTPTADGVTFTAVQGQPNQWTFTF